MYCCELNIFVDKLKKNLKKMEITLYIMCTTHTDKSTHPFVSTHHVDVAVEVQFRLDELVDWGHAVISG